MPVKIRLQRKGRKKRPFYHIVIADARAPRDGRFIESIGSYNPMTKPATIEIDNDKAYQWLMEGAKPTDTVRAILRFKGVLYKKHLMRGVKKGALTVEEAEQKYNAWLEEKEAKVAARFAKSAEEKAAFLAKVSGTQSEQVHEEEVKEEVTEEELLLGKIDYANEEEVLTIPITRTDSIIQLKIKGKLEEFELKDQIDFIERLKDALDTDEDIQLISIREGSVILSLKLSDENAKKILKLISTGELDGFDILEAELLDYRKEVEKQRLNLKERGTSFKKWKKRIKDKIANNELNVAFSAIKHSLSPKAEIYDETISLQARYNQKIKSNRVGTVNNEYFDQEMNGIGKSMLGIVNEIKESHVVSNFEI